MNSSNQTLILLSALSFILTVLTACVPQNRSFQSNNEYVIQDVPFFPENRYWCGPASLAGVMNYYQKAPKPEEIAGKIYSPSAGGTIMADLAWFARKHEFNVNIIKSDTEKLRQMVSNEKPVIVFVSRDGWLTEYNHFMVVVGFNNEGFIVNSGRNHQQFYEKEAFSRLWKKTDNHALIVVPKKSSTDDPTT